MPSRAKEVPYQSSHLVKVSWRVRQDSDLQPPDY
jgi:hypothetical protein